MARSTAKGPAKKQDPEKSPKAIKKAAKPPKDPNAPKKKTGRPKGSGLTITPAIQEYILKQLVEGVSVNQACKNFIKDFPYVKSPPSPSKVDALVGRDKVFGEKYSRARERGYLKLGDTILETAADMSIDPQHKRIIIDTQKWFLSKVLPKLYGDKIAHTGHDGGPIQITWDEAAN